MKKKVKIGFLGLGVVGAQLMNLIKENEKRVVEDCDVEIEIGKVLVRDLNKKRDTDTEKLELTTDARDVVEDPTVDIVVDCMGGAGSEMTKEHLMTAIRNGKSIVMSSKKCLAKNGIEIIKAVLENNVLIRYEATVGGGIPIASTIANTYQGETIMSIYGIFNATSNYIYTQINERKMSFDEALKEAQENGYAENDPTDDIDGYDSLYKILIMTGFGMHEWCDFKEIKPIPIKVVDKFDMEYVKDNKMIIKPISLIKMNNGDIEYYVGPSIVKENSMIANVKENNNIIMLEGGQSGVKAFYGQGAGAKPTAAIMYDDIISIIANSNELKYEHRGLKKIRHCSDVSEWRGRYYIRFTEIIQEDVLYEIVKNTPYFFEKHEVIANEQGQCTVCVIKKISKNELLELLEKKLVRKEKIKVILPIMNL